MEVVRRYPHLETKADNWDNDIVEYEMTSRGVLSVIERLRTRSFCYCPAVLERFEDFLDVKRVVRCRACLPKEMGWRERMIALDHEKNNWPGEFLESACDSVNGGKGGCIPIGHRYACQRWLLGLSKEFLAESPENACVVMGYDVSDIDESKGKEIRESELQGMLVLQNPRFAQHFETVLDSNICDVFGVFTAIPDSMRLLLQTDRGNCDTMQERRAVISLFKNASHIFSEIYEGHGFCVLDME